MLNHVFLDSQLNCELQFLLVCLFPFVGRLRPQIAHDASQIPDLKPQMPDIGSPDSKSQTPDLSFQISGSRSQFPFLALLWCGLVWLMFGI